jgi:hypothetical protein
VMDMATTRIIFAFGVLWVNPPCHGDIPVAYTRASPEEIWRSSCTHHKECT